MALPMTLPFGLFLDLVGIFVFGLSGAMLAVRRDLDLFGIAVLALATGLAGGVIRDALLGATPVAALSQPLYIWAALASALCAYLTYERVEKLNNPVMLMDALGLGLFAVTGCHKALQFDVALLPAILLGVLSAAGGGAVRDMLVAEVPRVLREEVYALAALAGAGIMALGDWLALPEVVVMPLGVLAAFLLRMLSVRRGWNAPKASKRD